MFQESITVIDYQCRNTNEQLPWHNYSVHFLCGLLEIEVINSLVEKDFTFRTFRNAPAHYEELWPMLNCEIFTDVSFDLQKNAHA